MRAKEFIINIPISIKINGNSDPEIDIEDSPVDPSIPKSKPIMVPPLQQQIELQKSGQGKKSPIIKDLTTSEIDPDDIESVDRA